MFKNGLLNKRLYALPVVLPYFLSELRSITTICMFILLNYSVLKYSRLEALKVTNMCIQVDAKTV